MRYILYITLSALSIIANAQVSINTTNPLRGTLHIDAKGNNSTGSLNDAEPDDDLYINSEGNIALGHTNPISKVHLKSHITTRGAIKIEDGSQGNTKILKSDESGNASWGHAGEILTVIGNFGNGINPVIYDYSIYPSYLYTGTTLTLPPGQWLVTITLNLTIAGAPSTDYTGRAWIRSTFSDNTSGGFSPDIMGAHLMSGLVYSTGYGTLDGFIILNNRTNQSKTYYYMLSHCGLINLPQTTSLLNFAGSSSIENRMIAMKMKNN
ncbi:hypothetical protein CLV62_101233 [Dysgonomonas alginatilytica]|uniref:Uncharacterized protein n=1 Tax=Dysgonomonas alginatilytica TaxID=1605892 RepID=A0A2V3PTA4_9BACT|nr:hypothetical protein [Dysgonomonas alginatilytica]PXV68967.1 hypothetical protein CLV62_101233 [Dysgonomonas alginatilytica]